MACEVRVKECPYHCYYPALVFTEKYSITQITFKGMFHKGFLGNTWSNTLHSVIEAIWGINSKKISDEFSNIVVMDYSDMYACRVPCWYYWWAGNIRLLLYSYAQSDHLDSTLCGNCNQSAGWTVSSYVHAVCFLSPWKKNDERFPLNYSISWIFSILAKLITLYLKEGDRGGKITQHNMGKTFQKCVLVVAKQT